jgi:hypothetical protein
MMTSRTKSLRRRARRIGGLVVVCGFATSSVAAAEPCTDGPSGYVEGAFGVGVVRAPSTPAFPATGTSHIVAAAGSVRGALGLAYRWCGDADGEYMLHLGAMATSLGSGGAFIAGLKAVGGEASLDWNRARWSPGLRVALGREQTGTSFASIGPRVGRGPLFLELDASYVGTSGEGFLDVVGVVGVKDEGPVGRDLAIGGGGLIVALVVVFSILVHGANIG